MSYGSRAHRRRTPSDSANNSHLEMIQLSKALSWVLRHGAAKEKIPMTDDGFVSVELLLGNERFHQYTIENIKAVVQTNDKQRFAMREDPVAGLQIRANQGHSLEVKDLELNPIENASDYACVVHGTYLKCWNSIKTSGLSRMNRMHIHFAPGIPGDSEVISGMRSSAEILIYIDIQAAINDGIKFFTSENNVILTQGNDTGFLLPKYFAKVVNRKNGQLLNL